MWKFLQYHNAVPVAISILFMGAGATFAASNPETIYSSEEEVVSIDNTYIASKDLSAFTPRAQIISVTEDTEHYYIEYTLATIDLVDYVWKDVTKEETMIVSKADLGRYRDLGLYVTEQLKQNIDRELTRLRETQEIEKKFVTHKVLATSYGGLIGKFLDDKTETLPGYTPVVVPPPPPPEPVYVASAAQSQPQSSGPQQGQQSGGSEPPHTAGPEQNVSSSSGQSSTDPTLTLQILGNNPARIPKGSGYADLGAVLTDDKDLNIGIKTYLNGKAVQVIQIDTAKEGEWRVRYEATDNDGNSVSAERLVIVFDPYPKPAAPEPTASSTTAGETDPAPDQTESVPTAEAESAPVPVTEEAPAAETDPAPAVEQAAPADETGTSTIP